MKGNRNTLGPGANIGTEIKREVLLRSKHKYYAVFYSLAIFLNTVKLKIGSYTLPQANYKQVRNFKSGL